MEHRRHRCGLELMYYKLKADSARAFHFSIWDAEVGGLDPDSYNLDALTFEIGTGNIEKVTRLISKHQLKVLIESKYADNELAYRYDRMINV
jgi:hypothetical protein